MTYQAFSLIGGAVALALLASVASSEIWDKSLNAADFAAFDQACKADEDVITDLINQSGDIEAFRNREIAVVGRIETQLFDGSCYEFRGVCGFDLPPGETVTPSVLFDERKVPLSQCLGPLGGKPKWEVLKTEGTSYKQGGFLRLE